MNHIITHLIAFSTGLAAMYLCIMLRARHFERLFEQEIQHAHDEEQAEMELHAEIERDAFDRAIVDASQSPEPHVAYRGECPNCGGTIAFVVPQSMMAEGAHGCCRHCGEPHPVSLGDCDKIERV